MAFSKPLGSDDVSGFEFVKEILDGDPTCAVNFDRLQYHPVHGYIIFEFLLCEEAQRVGPYTSHPSKYWHLNSQKFISLYKVAKDLPGKLILVNYAKKGTKHEDEVLVIEVIKLDEGGIIEENVTKMDRDSFASWFKKLNRECC